MEQSNQGTEPQFTGEAMKMPAGAKAVSAVTISKGPAFGLIITLLFLALVLVLLGLMFWNQVITSAPVVADTPLRPSDDMNQEPESTTARAQAEATTILSTSNELPVIEADLLSTDLTNLDAELRAIDAIIEGADTATTTP